MLPVRMSSRPLAVTTDQLRQLRAQLDELGVLLYDRMVSRLDGPSSLILAALRGLGTDPRSSARLGTSVLGHLTDRQLEILAWHLGEQLRRLGVDHASAPAPGEWE